MFKKHLSIFMLISRSSIYKVIGLITLMLLSESILLFMTIQEQPSFAMHIIEGHTSWIFGIVFLLLTFLLSTFGWERSEKQGYTVKRLSISEKAFFFWQSLYNTICFLLLWMFQILFVIIAFHFAKDWITEEYLNHQSIFVAFIESDFLHSLLPFSEIYLWLRNILYAISMGLFTAFLPYLQRNEKPYIHHIYIVFYILLSFSQPIADMRTILGLGIALVEIFGILATMIRKEPAHEN